MRRDTLAEISTPTPVYIQAVVASPNSVVSPVTSSRAALIQWYAFAIGKHFENTIASGIIGETLVIARKHYIVRVPTRYLQVYVAAANAKAHLLLSPLPPGLAVLTTSYRALDHLSRGELHYREHLLEEGAGVRLRAVVAPHTGRGIYRTTADDELVVVDEMEHPTLSVDVPEFA
jgi:hypothetical protein